MPLLAADDGPVQADGTRRRALQLPVVAEVLGLPFHQLEVLGRGGGLRVADVLVNK